MDTRLEFYDGPVSNTRACGRWHSTPILVRQRNHRSMVNVQPGVHVRTNRHGASCFNVCSAAATVPGDAANGRRYEQGSLWLPVCQYSGDSAASPNGSVVSRGNWSRSKVRCGWRGAECVLQSSCGVSEGDQLTSSKLCSYHERFFHRTNLLSFITLAVSGISLAQSWREVCQTRPTNEYEHYCKSMLSHNLST
jgi:hypothetical protein